MYVLSFIDYRNFVDYHSIILFFNGGIPSVFLYYKKKCDFFLKNLKKHLTRINKCCIFAV